MKTKVSITLLVLACAIPAYSQKKENDRIHEFISGAETNSRDAGRNSEKSVEQSRMRCDLSIGEEGSVHRGRQLWPGRHHVPYRGRVQWAMECTFDVRA